MPLFAAIFPTAERRRSVSDHTRSPRITSARESLRHREGAAAPRRGAVRGRPEPRQRSAGGQEGGRGLGARDDGRRQHPSSRGLPGHPQHRSRAVEGRDPLPPRCRARRGQGARDVDDVEVRADGDSVRRRQGRHPRRPQKLSPAELQRMTRRYTSEIINEIGPEKDIPAPDVGTNASVMAWIFDTYSMNKGHSVLGVVTGKPLNVGGSLGRLEATAHGALYCIQEAVRKREMRMEDLWVAVQGFGNVGSFLARFLAEQGAAVIAVSDSPRGCDNEAV